MTGGIVWLENVPGGGAGGGQSYLVLNGQSFPSGLNFEGIFGTLSAFPTARNRIPISSPGTLRRMALNVVTNTLALGLSSFDVIAMVNGVDSALGVGVVAGQTGIVTFDATVALVATDVVSFRQDSTAATGGSIEFSASMEYVP